MAPHSSTPAWKIPWTEEPGRLHAVHGVAKSQTRLSDFTLTFHFHALEKEMATHSSILAWRIPGTGEPGGLSSMGLHRVGHEWSDLAAVAATCRSKQFLVKMKNVFYFYLKSNDFFGQPNKSADRLWTLVTLNYSQSKGLGWNGQGLCPFPVKEFTFTGPRMIYKSKVWKKNCKTVIKKKENLP